MLLDSLVIFPLVFNVLLLVPLPSPLLEGHPIGLAIPTSEIEVGSVALLSLTVPLELVLLVGFVSGNLFPRLLLSGQLLPLFVGQVLFGRGSAGDGVDSWLLTDQ